MPKEKKVCLRNGIVGVVSVACLSVSLLSSCQKHVEIPRPTLSDCQQSVRLLFRLYEQGSERLPNREEAYYDIMECLDLLNSGGEDSAFKSRTIG